MSLSTSKDGMIRYPQGQEWSEFGSWLVNAISGGGISLPSMRMAALLADAFNSTTAAFQRTNGRMAETLGVSLSSVTEGLRQVEMNGNILSIMEPRNGKSMRHIYPNLLEPALGRGQALGPRPLRGIANAKRAGGNPPLSDARGIIIVGRIWPKAAGRLPGTGADEADIASAILGLRACAVSQLRRPIRQRSMPNVADFHDVEDPYPTVIPVMSLPLSGEALTIDASRR